MKIYPPSTLTDICKELSITKGHEKKLKADVKYLLSCLKVDAHKEKLKSLGFDPDNPALRRKLPYPAIEHIYREVFRVH